ncbi:MAG: hypothetical protein WBQ43_02785 [Terriglobales bacterium]
MKTAKDTCECVYYVQGISDMRGSFAAELFFWVLLIIPGILYSIYRRTGGAPRCPKCGRPIERAPYKTPLLTKIFAGVICGPVFLFIAVAIIVGLYHVRII